MRLHWEGQCAGREKKKDEKQAREERMLSRLYVMYLGLLFSFLAFHEILF